MAKLNLDNYNFIDLSETDLSLLTDEELEVYIKDTKEVLEAYKKKTTKAMFVFGLANGLLSLRGGELTKVTLFGSKWKKGTATKDEIKLVKKVISTVKKYLAFRIFINLVAGRANNTELMNPYVAKKKG